ncbi:hypothetical protein D9M72_219200 [compost metagenome]
MQYSHSVCRRTKGKLLLWAFARQFVSQADAADAGRRRRRRHERLVPATDELIAELARYRRAHDLPPTPQPGEAPPLVLPVIGRAQRAGRGNRDPGLSRGALHLILKEVFGLAAARLRARGPEWRRRPRCWPVPRPLAAPRRRLAHDRPSGRPALCAG